jgi:pantoate--beta-alanine ligase
MSSRNALLSAAGREQALALSRALRAAVAHADAGERSAEALLAAGREVLDAAAGVELEYLALVDPDSFEPLESLHGPALMAVAARVEDVRLIDNETLVPAGARRERDKEAETCSA